MSCGSCIHHSVALHHTVLCCAVLGTFQQYLLMSRFDALRSLCRIPLPWQ
jgi:hypothetical protein